LDNAYRRNWRSTEGRSPRSNGRFYTSLTAELRSNGKEEKRDLKFRAGWGLKQIEMRVALIDPVLLQCFNVRGLAADLTEKK